MSRYKAFKISIPTDSEGFVGRSCDAPGCEQYFKVFAADLGDYLYCPYCGDRFSSNSLITSSQLDYAKRTATEEARVHAINELQKMFKGAFSGSKSITYKSGPSPRKKNIQPHYVERKVDTEFECAECSIRFQVYGIFGYCPGCRCENLQIYDANWANIKQKLEREIDKDRQLRYAYGDLISTFEIFCNQKAKRFSQDQCNFQDLFEARKYFNKYAGVDILANLADDQSLALRRVFQKRHVYNHAGGEITERFVKKIPEDSKLLGTKAVLSTEELEIAATAMRITLGDLVKSIERPG